MDTNQYRDRLRETIRKFPIEVVGKYMPNPVFRSAVDKLARGADPYEVIASLIGDKLKDCKAPVERTSKLFTSSNT